MASDREDRIAALRERVTLFLQVHSGNTSITVQMQGGGQICGSFLSRLRDRLHDLHAADEADRLI